MTIQLRKADGTNFKALEQIYGYSFPQEEQITYQVLIDVSNDTDHLFYAICDDEALVGLNYLIVKEDRLYVLYLAIADGHQSKGYGKAVIREILRRYPDYRIYLNIEEVDAKYENYTQRVKRKDFYLSLGFESQPYLFTNEKGVVLETLAVNGTIAYEEMEELFAYFVRLG